MTDKIHINKIVKTKEKKITKFALCPYLDGYLNDLNGHTTNGYVIRILTRNFIFFFFWFRSSAT